MTTDYIPTTEEVRNEWTADFKRSAWTPTTHIVRESYYTSSHFVNEEIGYVDNEREEFDRWLEQHDNAVRQDDRQRIIQQLPYFSGDGISLTIENAVGIANDSTGCVSGYSE